MKKKINYRRRQILLALCLLLLLVISFGLYKYLKPLSHNNLNSSIQVTEVTNVDENSLELSSDAGLLINLETNQVLYGGALEKPHPVYSVSKIMFLYTIAQEIEKTNKSYDELVVIDDSVDLMQLGNFSSSGILSGQSYTIKDLFYATMISSGNDATLALAINIFGSHDKAVAQMNQDAQALGLNNASFVSTSGLDGELLNEVGIEAQAGQNLMSPADCIKLVQTIEKKYPIIIESAYPAEITISNGLVLNNVNKSLESFNGGQKGVYGLKTGSNAQEYSYSLISLKKNSLNQSIMALSFGSYDRNSLYQDIENLYNYSDQFTLINVADYLDFDINNVGSNTKAKLTLDKPYYLYINNSDEIKVKIADPTKVYAKQLDKLYMAQPNGVVGNLKLIDESNFFENKPLQNSSVIIGETKAPSKLNQFLSFIKDVYSK